MELEWYDGAMTGSRFDTNGSFNVFWGNIIDNYFNFDSVSFSVPTSRISKRMNYKAFTEFLNHSRESKELLGTSSLLRDQTGDRLQRNGGYMGTGDKNRIGNDSKNSSNISFVANSSSTFLSKSLKTVFFVALNVADFLTFCFGYGMKAGLKSRVGTVPVLFVLLLLIFLSQWYG